MFGVARELPDLGDRAGRAKRGCWASWTVTWMATGPRRRRCRRAGGAHPRRDGRAVAAESWAIRADNVWGWWGIAIPGGCRNTLLSSQACLALGCGVQRATSQSRGSTQVCPSTSLTPQRSEGRTGTKDPDVGPSCSGAGEPGGLQGLIALGTRYPCVVVFPPFFPFFPPFFSV